jgi:hypothetical protein
MADRFVFLASRFLWPLHGLVLLAAIGVVFGPRGVADYTYAMAVCAPLYFLAAFSFPIFLLVDSNNEPRSSALVWIRVVSAVATIPIMAAVSIALPSTQANVVFAVWLLKVSELLFDPLPTVIAAGSSAARRGAKLFSLDIARVLIGQAVLWYSLLGLHWGIVRTLVVLGLSAIAMNTTLLIVVPRWQRSAALWIDISAGLRRIMLHATPMTVAGALLALLISLPRLLADPALDDNERAIFGIAQVLGTGAAVLFNSVWLYELHRIRTLLAHHQLGEALTKNTVLSALFLVALAFGAVVLIFVQPPMFALFRISAPPSWILPLLFAALALQHCVSIYRDTLKFTGQQWREVQVIVQALGGAVATYYLLANWLAVPWLPTVVAMCAVAATLQGLLAIRMLYLHWRKGGPHTHAHRQSSAAVTDKPVL